MDALGVLVLVLLLLSSVLMVILILMQAGRGGGLSGAFGVGGDTSIFGAQTASVITKATAVLAAVFMLSCIGLAAIEKNKQRSTFDFGDDVTKSSSAEIGGVPGTGMGEEPGTTTGDEGGVTNGTPETPGGDVAEPDTGAGTDEGTESSGTGDTSATDENTPDNGTDTGGQDDTNE